jgi:hypothetical protein
MRSGNTALVRKMVKLSVKILPMVGNKLFVTRTLTPFRQGERCWVEKIEKKRGISRSAQRYKNLLVYIGVTYQNELHFLGRSPSVIDLPPQRI